MLGDRDPGSVSGIVSVWASDLEALCSGTELPGSSGDTSLCRDHGTYGDPGSFECCGCDEHDPQYRDYAAFCKLWRNFRCFSSGGDGAGFKCQQSQTGKNHIE